MEIKVDAGTLAQIIEAIKQLPVQGGSFEAVDRWVGIVIALENMLQTGQLPETTEE